MWIPYKIDNNIFKLGKYLVFLPPSPLPCITVKLHFCHDAEQTQTFLFFDYALSEVFLGSVWREGAFERQWRSVRELFLSGPLLWYCLLYYICNSSFWGDTKKKQQQHHFCCDSASLYNVLLAACAWPRFLLLSSKRVIVKYFSADRVKCFTFFFKAVLVDVQMRKWKEQVACEKTVSEVVGTFFFCPESSHG